MFRMNSGEVIVGLHKMKIAEHFAEFGLNMGTVHGLSWYIHECPYPKWL